MVNDPLMTIKVLAHVAHLRRGRGGSDTETPTATLVMLGIPPFFRAFGAQETVESVQADRPEAAERSETLRRDRGRDVKAAARGGRRSAGLTRRAARATRTRPARGCR